MGLAALSEPSVGGGPLVMTDLLGRKFWRFNADAFLNIAAGLVSSSRAVTWLAVARVHYSGATIVSLGSVALGTQANTGRGCINVNGVGQANFIGAYNRNSSSDASNKHKMVAGTQLQIIGSNSNNSGLRLYLNAYTSDLGAVTSVTNVAGGEVGRYSNSAGTPASIDLYELVCFTGQTSLANSDSCVAALIAGYNIDPVYNQIVLEGDSISATFGILTGDNVAMAMTTPGASWALPANWRVVNAAVSGSTIAGLVSRRDAANGALTVKLPGRNVSMVQIGFNDNSDGDSAVTIYANLAAYYSSGGTSVLGQGWEVRHMLNIAANTGQNFSDYRALCANTTQFLTDCSANAGNIYGGRMTINNLQAISYAPDGLVFLNAASGNAYMQGGGVHPTALGHLLMGSGGDTPQYGYSVQP